MPTLSEPMDSDATDIARARTSPGSPTAEAMAAHLMSQYGQRLGCWIRGVVPKTKQAKIDCSGVVNSTFAALCRGVGEQQFEFEGDANLWALLTTIARRKAIDRLRRKVNHEAALEEIAPTIRDRSSATAEEAELRDSLSALCEHLTEAEVAYLTLRLQGGWQQTEIAEEMQISTRQVRRIARSVELKALALFDGIRVEGASAE